VLLEVRLNLHEYIYPDNSGLMHMLELGIKLKCYDTFRVAAALLVGLPSEIKDTDSSRSCGEGYDNYRPRIQGLELSDLFKEKRQALIDKLEEVDNALFDLEPPACPPCEYEYHLKACNMLRALVGDAQDARVGEETSSEETVTSFHSDGSDDRGARYLGPDYATFYRDLASGMWVPDVRMLDCHKLSSKQASSLRTVFMMRYLKPLAERARVLVEPLIRDEAGRKVTGLLRDSGLAWVESDYEDMPWVEGAEQKGKSNSEAEDDEFDDGEGLDDQDMEIKLR